MGEIIGTNATNLTPLTPAITSAFPCLRTPATASASSALPVPMPPQTAPPVSAFVGQAFNAQVPGGDTPLARGAALAAYNARGPSSVGPVSVPAYPGGALQPIVPPAPPPSGLPLQHSAPIGTRPAGDPSG